MALVGSIASDHLILPRPKMSNPQEDAKTYKIVVLGDGGVGKSCLTWRFIHDQFLEKYDPTIDDAYRKPNFQVDGELCPLEICDTAGQDQFAATRDLYYKTGDGFLLCFSLVDKKTVDAVTERFNGIKSAKVRYAVQTITLYISSYIYVCAIFICRINSTRMFT